jgi:hypothetical protein
LQLLQYTFDKYLAYAYLSFGLLEELRFHDPSSGAVAVRVLLLLGDL